jgi:uncharacterized protein YceK
MVLGALLLSTWLSGCSTIYTLSSGVREPWSGTKLDVYILNSTDASLVCAAGAAIDYPFSLFGDAIVLAFMRPASVEPFTGPDSR